MMVGKLLLMWKSGGQELNSTADPSFFNHYTALYMTISIVD